MNRMALKLRVGPTRHLFLILNNMNGSHVGPTTNFAICTGQNDVTPFSLQKLIQPRPPSLVLNLRRRLLLPLSLSLSLVILKLSLSLTFCNCRKMVRGELYITVPSLFRCPISMDVMSSPVSLCTGVTYDRSSIQHWLDSGHDTCPATMQILPSKDFIPNLTLRRLINLWAQSHGPPSPSSSSARSISGQQLRGLILELQKNESQNAKIVESLSSAIVDFANVGDENRRYLAKFDGFISAIVDVLNRELSETEILGPVISILDSILPEISVRKQVYASISKRIKSFLSTIRLILRNGTLRPKIESARILKSIALDAELKRAIAENSDLLDALLGLLGSEPDLALHDAIFSCLIVVAVTRSTKAELVGSGLVKLLTTTLSNQNATKSVAEKAMKLLSVVSSCAEGRSAIGEEARCAGAVVERLMKVSTATTEEGVAVLWGVCCLMGLGERQKKTMKEAVVSSNGVAKILLVMQSGYCEGHRVRRMCGDLLRVLRIGFSSSDGFELGVGSYNTKTTHIMHC